MSRNGYEGTCLCRTQYAVSGRLRRLSPPGPFPFSGKRRRKKTPVEVLSFAKKKALHSISCWAQTEARNARLVSYMVCLRAWPHRTLKLALSDEKLGARDQASRTLTPHKLACKRPNDKPNFAAGARAEVRRRPSKFNYPLPSPRLAVDFFLLGPNTGARNARLGSYTRFAFMPGRVDP